MLSSTDQVTSHVRQAGGHTQHMEKACVRHSRRIHTPSSAVARSTRRPPWRWIHTSSSADAGSTRRPLWRWIHTPSSADARSTHRPPPPLLSFFPGSRSRLRPAGQNVSDNGLLWSIRIGPNIQFFSFSFSDTQWIRIHRVSDMYPYLIRIRRVSMILVTYRCFVAARHLNRRLGASRTILPQRCQGSS
jgi:hypothetical protein